MLNSELKKKDKYTAPALKTALTLNNGATTSTTASGKPNTVYDADRLRGQERVPMTGTSELDAKNRGVLQTAGTYTPKTTASTGAKFIPTSALEGMKNAKTTEQIEREKKNYAADNTPTPTPTQSYTRGGSTEQAAPAAAAPMQVVTPNNQVSMPQINGALPQYQFQQGQQAQFGYNGQAPQFDYNGQIPEYSYQGGQTPQFGYNGQTPQFDYSGQQAQFSYNGQAPQFSYNGQAAQFQQQQADPALQAQYRDAMAALEKMKGQTPTYGSAYDTQIQDLYQQITGRGPFKYDSKTDPLYQQYVQDYTMQGKMAMRDTMGQAAALTGGYGSSYGQAVGQQAYDQYLQKMADILPETYGMALDAYNAEGDRLAQNLALTQDLEQSDYARYLDKLNQHNIDLNRAQTDADNAYNRMIDADERAYGRSMDAYNRDLAAEQLAYSRAADQYNRDLTAEQQAYNRALTQYDIDQAAEAQAYSRAQDEYQRRMAADEQAYGRAQDAYNRDMTAEQKAYERNMDAYKLAAAREEQAYGRAADAYSRQLQADNTAYSRAQDAYNRGMTENELAYARQQDEYNRLMQENKLAYDRAMDQYDLGREVRSDNQKAQDEYYNKILGLMSIGYTPTAQDFADAGLTQEQGAALAAAYAPKEETHTYRQTPTAAEEEEGTATPQPTQMDSTTFRNMKSAIFTNRARGQSVDQAFTQAQNSKLWGQLSDAQKTELANDLVEYKKNQKQG